MALRKHVSACGEALSKDDVPLAHEQDALVCEEAKTGQAGKAEERQSEEEHAQPVLETTDVVRHVMVEKTAKH